ncbi:isoprenoid biosynthesis glyoxalase ElbB [Coraliomargarita parva]|uniref:isoprenoid biosynthesis glyoxalase ElbB n=1 Tax=Coraliomargarita parva TaxID=3014050 RepID=UPI0022B361BD|nr:isoprenoid biosynthesis glyoxalase ElbB [Coraliomargarita parva]
MKKVAVVLSGCGVFDGAEIHESVLTLLALDRAGAKVTCTAPDIAQKHVVNHATGEEEEEENRNVLEEAARIARGSIESMNDLAPDEFDAIIFVGGYGAAKNLCSLAFDGAEYDTDALIVDFIQTAHEQGKALGFMCIAPALAASALGSKGVQLTIGNDADTAAALEKKGAKHVNCPVDDVVVDPANKVVTTPAYMLAESITQAESGINKLVAEVLKLA